jgi:hypothetical protein
MVEVDAVFAVAPASCRKSYSALTCGYKSVELRGFEPLTPSMPYMRIPIESDHLFRSNPIADSGVSDHLAGAGVS